MMLIRLLIVSQRSRFGCRLRSSGRLCLVCLDLRCLCKMENPFLCYYLLPFFFSKNKYAALGFFYVPFQMVFKDEGEKANGFVREQWRDSLNWKRLLITATMISSVFKRSWLVVQTSGVLPYIGRYCETSPQRASGISKSRDFTC